MPSEESLKRYARKYAAQERQKSAEEAGALSGAERTELEKLRKTFAAQEEQSKRRFDVRKIPAEKYHKANSPGMPLTNWSDWHCGEPVSRYETAGMNEFTYDIFLRRVDNLVNRTIRLLRNYGGLRPSYTGIWCCLGGDMMSGGIHDELVETNWAPAVGQGFQLHGVLAGALLRLADEFGEVWVPCVVGNHGRNARKPRAKLRIHENSEYWLYKALEAHFANDKRFHFMVSEQTDVDFEIYGHRFKLTHGDALGVRGGDGIIGAIGPIMRGALKTNNADAQIGRDFDTLIIGHWHSYQPRGALFPAMVNGTLKGYDEYARVFLRARYSRPSQGLALVSPKHGIAAQWEVHCD